MKALLSAFARAIRPKAEGRSTLVGVVVWAAFAAMPGAAHANDFMPQTKVRITVMQWQPVKGAYEIWQALSGEYFVSDKDELALPVVGRLSVAGEEADTLAVKIAKRIQQQTGLIAPPETTVTIVEYPPIYVVGDVSTPGEYKYRKGMNAIQALALGGGLYRDDKTSAKEETQTIGDLRQFRIERLRSAARIARLKAEESGAPTIDFPDMPEDADIAALTKQVNDQEQVIFDARRSEIDRQIKSLGDLRELQASEISALEEKITASDRIIASAQRDFNNIQELVKKGVATASRQSDLERTLTLYQSERLDLSTNLMRARQNVSEAERNMAGLVDQRRTEVSSELQLEEGRLNITKVKEEVAREIMSRNLSASEPKSSVSYSILRMKDGAQQALPADETSLILPGDVVRVRASAGDAVSGAVSGADQPLPQTQ